MSVEIIAIGDELLRGIVHEGNAHWLAKRLAARGATLTRTTVLPDDPPVVAAELRAALARGPRMIVTHGGLGPTDDDRTREAIALGLGVPQERDPDAEAIVRARYDALAAGGVLDAGINDARLRMADLPRGARAWDNQVGTAPAFSIEAGSTLIVSLPGVPSELTWIWEHPLAALLDEVLAPGGYAERTHTLDVRDESAIAELLREVAAGHPGVYVKSRASGFGEDERIRVTLHATGRDDDTARAAVDAAFADVEVALARAGVRVVQ